MDAKVYNKKSNCKRAALIAHPDGRFEIIPVDGGFIFRAADATTIQPAPEGTEDSPMAKGIKAALAGEAPEQPAQTDDPDDLDDPTKPWNQVSPGLAAITDRLAEENRRAVKTEIEASPTVPVAEGRSPQMRKPKHGLTVVEGGITKRERKAPGTPASEPKHGSKGEIVIRLLTRPEGATAEQIMAETGWLAHTTRGYISRMKSSGQTVETTRAKGESTVYRLVQG
jgi:hypothetical protein